MHIGRKGTGGFEIGQLNDSYFIRGFLLVQALVLPLRRAAYEVTVVLLRRPVLPAGVECLFLRKEGILLTGDHVLFTITPNITRWMGVANSLQDYQESLNKVRKLPVRLALAAHRQNGTQLCERIDAILEHHQVRLRETYEAVRQGEGRTAYDIAADLTWSMRGRNWMEFPSEQKWFAVGETLAHLDALLAEHKIVTKKQDGFVRWYVDW